MKTSLISFGLRQACAVGLATMMLSTLAHANSGNCDTPMPVVPEANAGLVLLPIVAAALFFATRRLWKRAQGQVDQGSR